MSHKKRGAYTDLEGIMKQVRTFKDGEDKKEEAKKEEDKKNKAEGGIEGNKGPDQEGMVVDKAATKMKKMTLKSFQDLYKAHMDSLVHLECPVCLGLGHLPNKCGTKDRLDLLFAPNPMAKEFWTDYKKAKVEDWQSSEEFLELKAKRGISMQIKRQILLDKIELMGTELKNLEKVMRK